jgi:hypothetical protein
VKKGVFDRRTDKHGDAGALQFLKIMGYGLWSTEKNEREKRVGDAESKPRGGGGCL